MQMRVKTSITSSNWRNTISPNGEVLCPWLGTVRRMSDEPYKEEIGTLLSLVRITLYILAALSGVGLTASQIGMI